MESSKADTANQSDLTILSSTGKFGIKGIKYFGSILFIYGIVNTFYLIFSAYKFHAMDSTRYFSNIIVIVAVGILFTLCGLYLTYKYLLMDGIGVLYKHIAPFFKKLSSIVIDKISNVAVDKIHIKDAHLEKAFNVDNMLTEIYGHKVPSIAQKGLGLIIKQIPFTDIIVGVKDSIKDKDKEKASDILYTQIDGYVQNSILGGNSMRPVFISLLLNIIIQALLIYFIS